MRMGSLAHNSKTIWQARVGEWPVGHRCFIRVVMCLCVAIGLIGSPVWAKDSQSRCAQIGQKWEDFWNGSDVTQALDVFTRDIVYEDVTLGVHARGLRELKAFAQSAFDGSPVSRFQVEQSACQGQRGFLDWIWVAEDGSRNVPGSGFCGTGKQFTVRGAALLDIQGQRISHNVDFWDLTTLLRQLLPEGADCVARLLGLSQP